ncbi:hypothetical protein K2X33_16060 [bacterium]|nr:hypothetical protein [bacterium]
MRARFGVFFLGLFLAACGSDSVKYETKIQVSAANSLPASVLKIVNDINRGKAVSFSEISNELSARHARAYGMKVSELQSFLEKAERGISKDSYQAKVDYEKNVEKELGRKIIYNSKSVTLGHLAQEGRMQCYSGTVMHQVMLRRTGDAAAFQGRHAVVIYTSGHVKSGFMQKNAQGQWELTEVELTAGGRARSKKPRLASELGADKVVVDGDYFALIEIVKGGLSNPIELRDAIVSLTAKKYGIKQVRKAEVAGTPTRADSKEDVLNSSIFSFGQMDVEPGDKPRSEFEEQEEGWQVMSVAPQISDKMPNLEANSIKAFQGRWVLKTEGSEIAYFGIGNGDYLYRSDHRHSSGSVSIENFDADHNVYTLVFTEVFEGGKKGTSFTVDVRLRKAGSTTELLVYDTEEFATGAYVLEGEVTNPEESLQGYWISPEHGAIWEFYTRKGKARYHLQTRNEDGTWTSDLGGYEMAKPFQAGVAELKLTSYTRKSQESLLRVFVENGNQIGLATSDGIHTLEPKSFTRVRGETMVGSWIARAGGNSLYKLQLKLDGTFLYSYPYGEDAGEITGTFKVEKASKGEFTVVLSPVKAEWRQKSDGAPRVAARVVVRPGPENGFIVRLDGDWFKLPPNTTYYYSRGQHDLSFSEIPE